LQASGREIVALYDPAELDAVPGPYDGLYDFYAGLARRLGFDYVPKRTFALYEETLAKLAGDFPEFAFWANGIGLRKILDELTNVHQTAQAVLASTAIGMVPGKVRADLATRYQHEVGQPIADTAATASDAEIAALFRAVGRIAREHDVVASGYRFLANHGENAHQEVPHFHVHLFAGRPLGRMIPT